MNFNYKELSDRAYYYHSHNDLTKAEEIYLQLLAIRPDDVNILNLTGLLYLAENKVQESVNYLSKALILKKSAYIASNLAKAYYMNNEFEKSIKLYKQALSLGESDDIYYSMALTYKQLGDYDNVIKNYKKAIELNPNNYSAFYNLTLACIDVSKTDEAVYYAEKCLEIEQDEDIYAVLSGLYEEKGDIKAAAESLEKAAELNNKNYLYFYNLGVLYSKSNREKEAQNAYIKAIELNSSYIESYINLASLYKSKDNAKALFYLLHAYKIEPENETCTLSLAQTLRDLYKNKESIYILKKSEENGIAGAENYSLLAMNYMDMFCYDIAYDYYNKALKAAPDNLNYLHGKAVCLKYLGKIDEAEKLLEYIVQKDNTLIKSAVTLGMMYLTNKEFEKGMELYCQRSRDTKFKDVFKEKIWEKGINLEGKNILIYSDCGFGDTLMYSRFLSLLKQKAAKVTLQTDKELISLLKNSFRDINIIPKGGAAPVYDIVIPLMSLQYALDINFDKINSAPYLFAEAEKTLKFADLSIIKGKKNKTGLFWRGNRQIFKNRSIDFELIKYLPNNKKFSFYSFQIDEKVKEDCNIYNLKQYITDFSASASLLKNMDLLITIDSSIAHLAGALGVKTFLLLPYTAEWRWFNDNEKTIWYESVRIFKQKKPSDWHEVIDRIEKELNTLCL